MRMLWIVLLAAWALGGCAVHWIYEKPGVTPDQLARDKGACLQETPAGGLYAEIVHQEPLDRERFKRCMQRRGYSVRREE